LDLAAFIDRYDQAWNEQDVEAIMSMHTSDMVFENHTRAVRAEGAAVRQLLESAFADQPRPALPRSPPLRRRRLRGQRMDGDRHGRRGSHHRVGRHRRLPLPRRPDRTQGHLLRLARAAPALALGDEEPALIEWDGVDGFPVRDGLIARQDIYSLSHAPRLL
jgi:hypothetical protein